MKILRWTSSPCSIISRGSSQSGDTSRRQVRLMSLNWGGKREAMRGRSCMREVSFPRVSSREMTWTWTNFLSSFLST